MVFFISAASNGLSPQALPKFEQTLTAMQSYGQVSPVPDEIIAPEGKLAAPPKNRAQLLVPFFASDSPALAIDPTGGDLSNQILPYLKFSPQPPSETCRHKAYWGMSDNSTLLNALLDKEICRSFHGFCMTLAGAHTHDQLNCFLAWVELLHQGKPFPPELIPPVIPLTESFPHGELVGGNLRAFCKLLGTRFFPRVDQRILLLESLALEEKDILSLTAQLDQAGVFDRVKGVLIGKFSAYDKQKGRDGTLSLFKEILPSSLPLASCPLIGHGNECWTVPLGEELRWRFV